jgi:hypothetical protein
VLARDARTWRLRPPPPGWECSKRCAPTDCSPTAAGSTRPRAARAAASSTLSTAPTATAAFRAYERDRLPVTNRIATACRTMPADAILALVATRAPNGFPDVNTVLSPTELATLSTAYRDTSQPVLAR